MCHPKALEKIPLTRPAWLKPCSACFVRVSAQRRTAWKSCHHFQATEVTEQATRHRPLPLWRMTLPWCELLSGWYFLHTETGSLTKNVQTKTKKNTSLKKQFPGKFLEEGHCWSPFLWNKQYTYNIYIYTYVYTYINYLSKHKTLKLSVPLEVWTHGALRLPKAETIALKPTWQLTVHPTDVTSWQTPWIKDQVDHI